MSILISAFQMWKTDSKHFSLTIQKNWEDYWCMLAHLLPNDSYKRPQLTALAEMEFVWSSIYC